MTALLAVTVDFKVKGLALVSSKVFCKAATAKAGKGVGGVNCNLPLD
jgi:hypothetical protein